jgi:hypothetical protein
VNSRSPGFNDRKASSLWWGLLVVAGLIVFIALVASARRASVTGGSDAVVTVAWIQTGPGGSRAKVTYIGEEPQNISLRVIADVPAEDHGFVTGTTERVVDTVTVLSPEAARDQRLFMQKGESGDVTVHVDMNRAKRIEVIGNSGVKLPFDQVLR